MATLDTHCKLKVKSVKTKDVSMEAANNANTVLLSTNAGLNTYKMKLPIATPTANSILQSTSAGDDIQLVWKPSTRHVSGSSLPADSALNDNEIFNNSSTKQLSYGINGKWNLLEIGFL